jgi:uncharacterized protein YqhQ
MIYKIKKVFDLSQVKQKEIQQYCDDNAIYTHERKVRKQMHQRNAKYFIIFVSSIGVHKNIIGEFSLYKDYVTNDWSEN